MGSINGGLFMLKEMIPFLPMSQRKIAEYILENPEIAIRATALELADGSETSSAAVIRLCKSLGLKGFQELKIRISGDLHRPLEGRYKDIESDESQKSIMYKMTNNSIQALKETSEIINLKELRKATEAIIKARKIHFFGVGASSIIAYDAQQKLLRIDKNAYAFTDIHMIATLVANATKDDVVVGISFSGETTDVYKILKLANKQGATTISLTRYGTSTISSEAKIKLFSSASKEAVYRSSATSSRLAQLHIIDILFMCIVTQQHKKSIKCLDETRKAIDLLELKNSSKRYVREEKHDKQTSKDISEK